MGSKRRRGGIWELQVYRGRDPVSGRKQYYYESFRGTERQAERRLAEIETDMARKEFTEPSRLSFYEYLINEFLPHIRADATLGTWEDYASITEHHLRNDALGRTVLTDITARHVEAYKLRKLAGPRADGRPGTLSPKTVKNHIVLIKAAIRYACVLGMLKTDPVRYVTFPKVPRHQPRFFTEEQAAAFLDAASRYAEAEGSVKFYLYFLLAIYTGLRQGELRAVRWSAVDLEHSLIAVTQKVRRTGDKAVFSDPKTEGSYATVSFDAGFADLFKQLRKEQVYDREKCLRLGITYRDHGLVFAGYYGNPLDRKVVVRALSQICRDAGVPEINPHGLRHTCATLLISSGVHLKTVQERLRHADIRTTGNIYSHVLPRMQEDANRRLNKVLRIERQKERQNEKPAR